MTSEDSVQTQQSRWANKGSIYMHLTNKTRLSKVSKRGVGHSRIRKFNGGHQPQESEPCQEFCYCWVFACWLRRE
jgi:hypothetical protein